MKTQQHDKWFVMEEIENSHPLLAVDAKLCCVDAHKYGIPNGIVTQTIIKSEKDYDVLCFKRSEFRATSKAFFDKITTDLNWAFGISAKIIETTDKLFALSESIRKTDPKKLSNAELGKAIEQWATVRREAHGYGMPWNYVEYEDQLLSSFVNSYIAKCIAAKKLDLISNKVFSFLSTPREKTFAKLEEEEILGLAIKVKGNTKLSQLFAQSNTVAKILSDLQVASPVFAKSFDEHFEKYRWLSFMYLGPGWNREYFAEVIQELCKRSESELVEELQCKQQFYMDLPKQQDDLMEKLGFDELHQKYVLLSQSMIYTKAYRKDGIYHGLFCLENFFKEGAKRLGLSLKQFRMLMSWEIEPALRSGKVDIDLLNKRYAFRVFHYDGKQKTVLAGDEAKKFFADVDFEIEQVTPSSEIKGDCACPGKGEGQAKVINLTQEMDKMKQGDILVSRATTPDIVPAMKKASAIVTDMGGITCHAAIVSRELNIPCVIGTKIATKVFKDGDNLIVDATHGTVRRA